MEEPNGLLSTLSLLSLLSTLLSTLLTTLLSALLSTLLTTLLALLSLLSERVLARLRNQSRPEWQDWQQ